MSIAISPLAIFIVTLSNPPVILRLPYNRIVKYVSHIDMNIFMFWSLKDGVQLSDIVKQFQNKPSNENISSISENDQENVDGETGEKGEGGEGEDLGFDPNQYCDCIYLVTEYVKEIQFLFETYFKMVKYQIPPCLPGDTLDDDDQDDFSQFGSFDESSPEKSQKQNNTAPNTPNTPNNQSNLQNEIKRQNIERRSSRLNILFQVLYYIIFIYLLIYLFSYFFFFFLLLLSLLSFSSK